MLVVLPAISWKEKILWIKNYLLSFCTLSWYGANLRTTTFFQLTPFRSPLTHPIYFGEVGKLLTSATRTCSPLVDSVSHAMPKNPWLLGLQWLHALANQQVQPTVGPNGHNRQFDRPSLVSSVCRSVRMYTTKIELWVLWAAAPRCVLHGLQRTSVKPTGFECTGAISRVIVKFSSSSDLKKKYAYAGNLRID